MNKKFSLIFVVLIIFLKFIICDDECSVYSCSNLTPETTGKICTFNSKCESRYTSCEAIPQDKCDSAEISDWKIKGCTWDSDTVTCKPTLRECSEYSDVSGEVGFNCEGLKASTNGKYCIKGKNNICVEVSGCISDTGNCEDRYPLDSNHKWDHTKICDDEDGNSECTAIYKKCGDYKGDGDICINLKTENDVEMKCFYDVSKSTSCFQQYTDCNYYKGENKNEECEDISDYLEDQTYKCVYDSTASSNKCKKIKKGCSDFEDKSSCESFSLSDSSKKCVFKTIDSVSKCYELYTTCNGYNSATVKNQSHCEAIEEDSYSECKWEDSECVKKPKYNCNDNIYKNAPALCDSVRLNATYRCLYNDFKSTENKCVESIYYDDCDKYKGNDILICEKIIPPESNKRCILKDDKECVSLPKDCSDYDGDNEYECINNYKPLDENYKCVFKNDVCVPSPKYKYEEYCSQGDSTTCENIIPKNNGENYSIKCKWYDESKMCVRVEKTCEEVGTDVVKCSKIIPKDQNKWCIIKDGNCYTEYKTCQAYNSVISSNFDKDLCEGIVTNDGTKCKGTPGENNGGTCTIDTDKTYICDNSLDNLGPDFLKNTCNSIRLSDISKKCVYNKGECTKESKKCLELEFNGNENNIENICQAAEVTDSTKKKCIISSDKTHCIEIDKSFIIEDNTNDNTGNNDSNGGNINNNNNQQGQTEENNTDSGKNIYINSLLIIILFLLF